MKYWLSHLPLEVWVDIYRYPWITRKELGRIVHRFGNRKYTEYLQFYLHDWGKRKLDKLTFSEYGCSYRKYYLNVPQTPMPANIKSFEIISINHFDAQTIAFLRLVRPILTDVKVQVYGIPSNNLTNLRITLANLVPLLNRIHSLICDVRVLPTVTQCFGNEQLAKLKKLTFFQFDDHVPMDEATRQTAVNILTDWLTSPGPKLCKALIHNDTAFGQQMLSAIREKFLVANHPSSFAVKICLHRGWQWQFAEFHLTNGIGEELHGLKHTDERFQINRHAVNCGRKLQKWVRNNTTKSHRGRIEIRWITIGLLDAIDPLENEDKEQKPSTSKEA